MRPPRTDVGFALALALALLCACRGSSSSPKGTKAPSRAAQRELDTSSATAQDLAVMRQDLAQQFSQLHMQLARLPSGPGGEDRRCKICIPCLWDGVRLCPLLKCVNKGGLQCCDTDETRSKETKE